MNPVPQNKLADFLEEAVNKYNCPDFIPSDPISIPHLFTKKEDIEIAGFLAATISWGQRKSIVRSGIQLMERMDYSPYEFIMNAPAKELSKLNGFVYRTFNTDDCLAFLNAIRQLYLKSGGLENVFNEGYMKNMSIKEAITHFRQVFLSEPHLPRTEKHISNPAVNSAAKRINMFLRWMVRKDEGGVDFGIWKKIHPAELICPLDVHSGRVARKLGLLQRKQDDWKADEELTAALKLFDPADPVKYDFALFGLGAIEKF